jgi:hypothetical protein
MGKECGDCSTETCLCCPWQTRIRDELERHGETLEDLEAVGWSNGEWAVWTPSRVYYPDRDSKRSEAR